MIAFWLAAICTVSAWTMVWLVHICTAVISGLTVAERIWPSGLLSKAFMIDIVNGNHKFSSSCCRACISS